MKTSLLTRIGAFGAMACSGLVVSNLTATIHPVDAPAGLDAHETHASASLLGQFRSSVSGWLWLRTDLYLHNGVEMRPMTEAEKRSGTQSHSAAEDGHEQLMDESAVVTLIPSAERDFRGIFGDIERATSAYKDMHEHIHNDPAQALPLFRLMTWLDPKFVTGWTVGGSVLSRDRTDAGADRALEYLRQGLAENPENIAIRAEMGQLLASHKRDFTAAIVILQEARQLALKSKSISPEEKEELRQVYRWLGLSYKSLGQDKNLKQVAQEGVQIFPDDLVLARLLSPPPLVLTQKGELDWLQHVLEDSNEAGH